MFIRMTFYGVYSLGLFSYSLISNKLAFSNPEANVGGTLSLTDSIIPSAPQTVSLP